jgi:hypothetical protein
MFVLLVKNYVIRGKVHVVMRGKVHVKKTVRRLRSQNTVVVVWNKEISVVMVRWCRVMNLVIVQIVGGTNFLAVPRIYSLARFVLLMNLPGRWGRAIARQG